MHVLRLILSQPFLTLIISTEDIKTLQDILRILIDHKHCIICKRVRISDVFISCIFKIREFNKVLVTECVGT